jgi:NADH-quinone oxidoreductase subunit E/NADP-reducing hydrogenase subunit HndA
MSDTIVKEPTEQHVDEPPGFFGAERAQTTEEIPPEVWDEIGDFLSSTPGGHERLIPLLHRVQERLGYLPFPVQEVIADKLGLSPIQVYGVISFYHFFTTTPRGKHDFKVCMGTACFVRHAQRLVETIKQVFDIDVGEVTADRLFGLEQVRCLGACGLAPAMMHNGETVGNLTTKELRKMVLRLQSKERRKKKTESREAGGD